MLGLCERRESVYIVTEYCFRGSLQVSHGLAYYGKKTEVWLNPMTKAPTQTEKFQKTTLQHKKRHPNFDYITIADQLRMVSWSNNSHPTGVV